MNECWLIRSRSHSGEKLIDDGRIRGCRLERQMNVVDARGLGSSRFGLDVGAGFACRADSRIAALDVLREG